MRANGAEAWVFASYGGLGRLSCGPAVTEKGLVGFAAPDGRGVGNCTAALMGIDQKAPEMFEASELPQNSPVPARAGCGLQPPSDSQVPAVRGVPCVAVWPEREEKLLNFLVRPEHRQDFR